MVEIRGEVDHKDRSQMTNPWSLKPNSRELIPVLRIRVLTESGNRIQVIYKGETPGDVDIGDQVIVKGVNKGGVIHTRSIFNLTTNSWVTPPPGFLRKIFGDLF